MLEATHRDGKARLATVVCVLLVTSLVPAVMVASPGAASSSDTERFVVGFYEMPDERERYQGEPVALVGEDVGFFAVETDEPERFQQDARQDERVRYVEEDHRDVEPAYTPNDPRYPDQYGPQITTTDTAWDVTTGSTAVIVGFLDSGIREGHEDFEFDRVQDGYDYKNGDGTPEDSAACGFHGSHVAGIASATIDNGEGIAGMAQHTIVMHKIFDENSNGDCEGTFASTIADALTDLADKGAHVSSNSWVTGRSSSTINDAIDQAHSNGVKHVGAAGNDGSCSDCVRTPWKDRPNKVVIVSCTDSNDGWCSFSSEGPEVDLAAPGRGVLSVDGGTTSGYTEKSGTSMSTPHVSGAVSLYIAQEGDKSFSTIEDRIVSTADDVGLSSDQQGGGRLDTSDFLENAQPVAAIDASCHELNCTFDGSGSFDEDGSIDSYDWDFGDGTTGTGEVVDHGYDREGDYEVTLTVTDDRGATDQETQTVSVQPNQPPDPSIDASCHELNCTFDASGSSDSDGSVDSYDWDFGDGTTGTGEVVDHGYDSEGDYEVTLTVTDDDGASAEATTTVSVQPNQPPTATFDADCHELNCTFDAEHSYDEDGSIASYEWDFGDGTTGTGEVVDHGYDSEGDYEVTLTVTDDDGVSSEATTTVSVQPNQPPEAVMTADCEYLSCSLDGLASSDSDGQVAAYAWDLGDGSTDTRSSFKHTYDEPGDYEVTLTVTDDDGAQDTTSRTVTLEQPPPMHVHRVDHRTSGQDVVAEVWIYDANEDPVAGAAVTIEMCDTLGVCQTSTETTSVFGEASMTWSWGVGGVYETCVLDLDHSERDHAPADDHAEDGNCDSEFVWPTGTGG